MSFGSVFIVNSILLGVGLAMDAFSVSMANGMNETDMKKSRMCFIAGIYAFFQAIMPLIGWICVHTALEYFSAFQKFIPWIALVLLAAIGGKMLFEGICNKCDENTTVKLTVSALIIQGIATSIDALSVGFTVADYNFFKALVCVLIISAVTFVICLSGLLIGKKFGNILANKASILGGIILIAIGIEIFVTGIF